MPTILLVDDDVDFVEMNRRVLEAAGHRVLCAHDPAEAVGILETQRPDLIVTDLIMDSLDAGLGFAKKVKADPRWAGIPIVIATSITSRRGLDLHPRTDQDLKAMSVDAYFDKPVAPGELVKKVAELLKRTS